MGTGIALIVGIPAILIAIVVHEFSHGYAAYLLGDNTAKNAGRLTLNPIAHIDMWGTIIIPLIMLVTSGAAFGWAKPVPFNPYNLKYPKYGPAIVAIAGPLSNLIIAFIALMTFRVLVPTLDPNTNLLMMFLLNLALLNVFLMVFNLVPVPPLDGSKVLFVIFSDLKYAGFRHALETQGPFILLTVIILDNFLNLGIFGGLFKLALSIVYKLLL
jgi:Zn-dependent protease